MSEPQIHHELQHLDTKLNNLMDLCERLQQENRSLKHQQQSLIEERSKLIEKNELARGKVESMITRLKSLETTQ